MFEGCQYARRNAVGTIATGVLNEIKRNSKKGEREGGEIVNLYIDGIHLPLSESCGIRDAIQRSGKDIGHARLTCIIRMWQGESLPPTVSLDSSENTLVKITVSGAGLVRGCERCLLCRCLIWISGCFGLSFGRSDCVGVPGRTQGEWAFISVDSAIRSEVKAHGVTEGWHHGI